MGDNCNVPNYCEDCRQVPFIMFNCVYFRWNLKSCVQKSTQFLLARRPDSTSQLHTPHHLHLHHLCIVIPSLDIISVTSYCILNIISVSISSLYRHTQSRYHLSNISISSQSQYHLSVIISQCVLLVSLSHPSAHWLPCFVSLVLLHIELIKIHCPYVCFKSSLTLRLKTRSGKRSLRLNWHDNMTIICQTFCQKLDSATTVTDVRNLTHVNYIGVSFKAYTVSNKHHVLLYKLYRKITFFMFFKT